MKRFIGLALTILMASSLTTAAQEKAKLDAPSLAKEIDRLIQQRLDKEKVPPAARADDADFLRRVHLDLTGTIPAYEKTLAFLESKDPAKRTKLVDDLLASPHYSRYMAGIWASRLVPRELSSPGLNRNVMVERLGGWFDEAFQKDKPWNKVVHEALTATGRPEENGAATLFQNGEVDKLTDAVGRMFLGVQLQCAQCHNDRLDRPWQRNDYWGMAAFFFKVRENRGKNEGTPGITEEPSKFGKRKLPETAKIVDPKFLQHDTPKLDPSGPLRPVLADWLTSPKNPYFAKSMVNRQWAHLFGRGLVNPVDDLHEKNPPSHPEMLDLLTAQFIAHDFDVKYVLRAICLSDAYQRTSATSVSRKDSKTDAVSLFARMAVKDLTPRQMKNTREVLLPKKPGNGPKAQLYADLIEDADATEFRKGIPDTLGLMNAKETGQFIKDLANRIVPNKNGKAAGENVELLYLHILSRRPTDAERIRLTAYLDRQGQRAYQDICWALLNSAEFLLNH